MGTKLDGAHIFAMSAQSPVGAVGDHAVLGGPGVSWDGLVSCAHRLTCELHRSSGAFSQPLRRVLHQCSQTVRWKKVHVMVEEYRFWAK